MNNDKPILIQADSNAAEARVIWHLAGDHEALRLADTIDYHAHTAVWFFGPNAELFDYDKRKLGYEHPIRFVGKAQPLHSKILTPTGWKLMKDIRIGDTICDHSYKVCRVTDIFPQGVKEVYKITLSDGSEVESCLEHLWPFQTMWAKQRGYCEVKPLSEIMKLTRFNSRGNPNLSVLMNNAMQFDWQELPINPYILGVLLGDGSFRTPYGCSFFTDDNEILQEFINNFGNELISQLSDRTYYIRSIRNTINKLGLDNKYSHEKFVPEIYKFNTLENRLEILRGLLDTDGTINQFGSGIEFSTSSEQLMEDVVFLVRSLGGIANVTSRIPKYEYKGEILDGKKSYRVFINIRQLNPFKLSRKAERWEIWNNKTKYNLSRNIISIEKSGEFPCQCIAVDSEDHLYITNDFIPTHNTLRHAGHLGAGKRRASLEVNTSARKYKIPIHISEQIAERALKIFHEKQPKIRQVFHKGIIDCLQRNRQLIAPVPYGINCKYGGRRLFFERWGDDLFRQGFSYIPQRAVSDNTKAAGLRIIERIRNWEELGIILEAHDALLFRSWESQIEKHTKIIREEFERPIDFTNCSISRGKLSIPCEVELGSNYGDLKKFKFKSDLIPKKIEPEVKKSFIVG